MAEIVMKIPFEVTKVTDISMGHAKIIKICQEMSIFTKNCQDKPRHCQKLPSVAKNCRELSRNAKNCQKRVVERYQSYQEVSGFTKNRQTSPKLQKIANSYQALQKKMFKELFRNFESSIVYKRWRRRRQQQPQRSLVREDGLEIRTGVSESKATVAETVSKDPHLVRIASETITSTINTD